MSVGWVVKINDFKVSLKNNQITNLCPISCNNYYNNVTKL